MLFLWILFKYPNLSNQFSIQVRINIFDQQNCFSSQFCLRAGYLSWILAPLLEMLQKCVHQLILRINVPHWNWQSRRMMKYLNIVDFLLLYFVNQFLKLSVISNFIRKCIEIWWWTLIHPLYNHLLTLIYVHPCMHAIISKHIVLQNLTLPSPLWMDIP